MKYHIDTIPIWDAFKSGGECPLCSVYEKCEADFVGSALGGSVMEPATRVEVNKSGFCAAHLGMLYGMQNRLGLALMLHTHIREVIGQLEKGEDELIGQLEQEAKKGALERAARAVARSAPSVGTALALSENVRSRAGGCFICNRLSASMQRYVMTVAAMWENEKEFQKAFAASKGFCLEHYGQLLEYAAKHMTGANQRAFTAVLVEVERAAVCRIEKELAWYTLKFDYRNREKPWGDSRDAVERTMLKLRSFKSNRTGGTKG